MIRIFLKRCMTSLLPIGTILFMILCGQAEGQVSRPDQIKYSSWRAKRPHIKQIIIEGNDFISDAEIKGRLFSRQDSFFQRLKSGNRNRVLRYTPNRDTLEVRYLYLRQGFLNVGITESFEISLPDSNAIVRISIVEGERFLVRTSSLTADKSIPFYNELTNQVNRMAVGDPVDPLKISDLLFELKAVYANNGYPYANVNQVIDTALGVGNSVIEFITESGPLVHFGEVIIEEQNNYAPLLAEREISIKKGEKYSRAEIIKSQRNLYSTNLFHSIHLGIKEAVNDSSLNTNPDFYFSAIERKPHFVSLNTGASQDSAQDLTWDFSAAWGKRNIFVSRRTELSYTSRFVSFEGFKWRPLLHRFQVRFTEPWFLKLRLPLTLTGRFEPGVKSQKGEYRTQVWSLGLSSRKEWSRQLFALISGEYESLNIYGVAESEADIIRDQEDISIRRKLTATLVRDTRLDKFIPRSGSFTTYFAQYVGGFLGGDDSFVKFEFSWARYQPMVGPIIFASRLKSGLVQEFGNSKTVPTNDRFYLGGANSIRGFNENSIGVRQFDTTAYNPPVVDTVNIGSRVYLIFNSELRFPIKWKFWGSIFTDIGNGWEKISKIHPDQLLFSYGAGLQFISPAGPIRLDYAHHLENGFYLEDDRWHITILYAF